MNCIENSNNSLSKIEFNAMSMNESIVMIYSPRIGQHAEETSAQAKLRFGCVSSSISAIRY
jgi:hypothetical protein